MGGDTNHRPLTGRLTRGWMGDIKGAWVSPYYISMGAAGKAQLAPGQPGKSVLMTFSDFPWTNWGCGKSYYKITGQWGTLIPIRGG